MNNVYQPTSEAEIRFSIPLLPPRECSPNARVHWTKKNRAGKAFGMIVRNCALRAIENYPLFKTFEKAEINLTLIFARRGRRDPDNYWGCFKPGMDALVDAGILAGDDSGHLKLGQIDFRVEKSLMPMTIITVKRI